MLKELAKYVARPDFKELLSDDCVLVLDTDLLAFEAASCSQESSIIVKNEELKFLREFPNKTEFKGRKRKDEAGEGSVLFKMNQERVENGKEPLKPSDFEYEDVIQTKVDFERCCATFHSLVKKIVEHVGASDYLLLTKTGSDNFRFDIPLPEKYKGQREKTMKPIYLKRLKDYIAGLRKVIDVPEDVEVDDYISIYGYDGYRNYLKTGKFNYIVSCLDKDAFQTPSLVFYFQRAEGKFNYPEPFLIPDTSQDVGKLELVGTTVKGYGLKFLVHQILYGDESDHYSVYKYLKFPKGTFGEKASYNLLNDLKTPHEILEALKQQMLKFFPDGVVRYTSWQGDEVNVPWHQYADMVFRAAYMRRSVNDPTDLYKLLDMFGVNLEVECLQQEEGPRKEDPEQEDLSSKSSS